MVGRQTVGHGPVSHGMVVEPIQALPTECLFSLVDSMIS